MFKNIRLYTTAVYLGACLCLFGSLQAEEPFSYQPALDPQTELFLKDFNRIQQQPFDKLDVSTMRQTLPPSSTTIPVKKTQDLNIKGPLGLIPIRIYTPEGKGPFPVYISFEGGGWVAGNLDSNDAICREICKRSGCLVVSVEYRKAPENPFPKPLEDCYAATAWIADHIQEFNGNPKLLAVGGDSAGGNLAAAVTLLARAKGPFLRCQVLMYPVTNFDFDTLSYYENAEGYLLTRDIMKRFWSLYLNGADGKNSLASPLQANLYKLPPAMVIVAYFDPLRDEGLAYAYQLKKFGVPVVLRNYPTIHGFISFGNQLKLSHQALAEISQFLKQQMR
ncbi:lipase [Candidatus Protochlamydia naegleriophila]|uniref:Lipase n=1 Tax=Candidatus Protochlamydia naegleriophila TaxID=389348 RepID=A0A0U5EUF9_9BACT|nr:alpha/beta hydrolase [Candidatus Protochlamydia naegleriophila]CUI17888.1 lipase [Candidatus Protochlamydia naegleriophila]